MSNFIINIDYPTINYTSYNYGFNVESCPIDIITTDNVYILKKNKFSILNSYIGDY